MKNSEIAAYIALAGIPMATGCASAVTPTTITDAVLADAAKQTGVAREDLVVMSSESVVWSDGSLGCPAPGMMYTQALVPGYRIKVRAGQAVLDYHASAKGSFVACPPERSIDPANDSIR